MQEDRFGVGVKLHDGAIFQLFLKRMVYNRTRLVMLNLDRWFRSGPVTGSFDMACYYVLWPLKPFEADHGGSAALRFAALDTALSELIYLLTGDSRFRELNAVLHRDPNPRIGNVSVEFVRIEAMDNAPRLSAQHHDLFCRAEPLALNPHCQPVINLIRTAWHD